MKSVAAKLFAQKTGMQRIKLMHPYRDWFIGLLVALLIMILMVGWSAFVYFDQREGIAIDESRVEVAIPAYRAELVDQALDIFTQRAARTAALVTSESTQVPVVSQTAVATSTTATTSPNLIPVEVLSDDVEPVPPQTFDVSNDTFDISSEGEIEVSQ
jgi:hypothetical protein